jgi:hypothetical protein
MGRSRGSKGNHAHLGTVVSCVVLGVVRTKRRRPGHQHLRLLPGQRWWLYLHPESQVRLSGRVRAHRLTEATDQGQANTKANTKQDK